MLYDPITCFGLRIEALRPSQQSFSHVGTEPPLPGYYQYFLGVNVSYSRIQHGDLSEDRTPTSRSGVRCSNTRPPRLPLLHVTIQQSYRHLHVVLVLGFVVRQNDNYSPVAATEGTF